MTPAPGQSPEGSSRPSAASTAPTSAPAEASVGAPGGAQAPAPAAPAERGAYGGRCPQGVRLPGFWALRAAAFCHFVFGTICFVAGLARLMLLLERRWLGDGAFYARGSRIMRTFIVAAVGLFLFGVGTALDALREFLRSRYRHR